MELSETKSGQGLLLHAASHSMVLVALHCPWVFHIALLFDVSGLRGRDLNDHTSALTELSCMQVHCGLTL